MKGKYILMQHGLILEVTSDPFSFTQDDGSKCIMVQAIDPIDDMTCMVKVTNIIATANYKSTLKELRNHVG